MYRWRGRDFFGGVYSCMPQGLLVGVLVCVSTLILPGDCQLLTNTGTLNPFGGQGITPYEGPSQAFPVKVQALVTKLLDVDEETYTFSTVISWILQWEDERATEIISSNYTRCSFYCSSKQSAVLNPFGQPACCDHLYVPQAETINLSGLDSQNFPYKYIITTDGARVRYKVDVKGNYSTSFAYPAFPWDKHYLCIDLLTSFYPEVGTEDLYASTSSLQQAYLLESQRPPTDGPEFVQGFQRPVLEDIGLAGWQIGKRWLEAINFTYIASVNAQDLQGLSRNPNAVDFGYTSLGVRIYIEVFRVRRPFYIAVVVLPISLIVIFSFGMFSIPRDALKSRVNLQATLFLTIIILQFVLQGFLPGVYTITTQIWLVLVSYAYIFLLLAIAIISNWTLGLPERHARLQKSYAAKDEFAKWRAAIGKKRPTNGTNSATSNVCHANQVENGEHATGNSSTEDGRVLTLQMNEDGCKEDHTETRQKAPDDTMEENQQWYSRQQKHWTNNFCLTRHLAFWTKFSSMKRSKRFLEDTTNRFETSARLLLLVMYLATVFTIFGVAFSRVEEGARPYALPMG